MFVQTTNQLRNRRLSLGGNLAECKVEPRFSHLTLAREGKLAPHHPSVVPL